MGIKRLIGIGWMVVALLLSTSTVAFGETEWILMNEEAESLTNLYAEPSVDADVVGQFYDTVSVDCLEMLVDDRGQAWAAIQINSVQGYIKQENVVEASISQNLLLQAFLTMNDLQGKLTVYAQPSTASESLGELLNGSLVWVLGYLPDGWCYLKSSALGGIYGFTQIDNDELADSTKAPPEHPIYESAYLDLETGSFYRFDNTLPADLQQAFEDIMWEGFVPITGSIAAATSNTAAVLLCREQQVAICLLERKNASWEIVDYSLEVLGRVPSAFGFDFNQYGTQISFPLDWEDYNAICWLQYDDLEKAWYIQAIGLYGTIDENDYDLYTVPIDYETLEISGRINAYKSSEISVDTVLVYDGGDELGTVNLSQMHSLVSELIISLLNAQH